MTKPELLAPAGDLERLKMAITYGADAVYIGGEAFGLRVTAANFDMQAMREGIRFAHERGAKVYVTVNVIPHNGEIDALPEYLSQLNELRADGIILADLGVLALAKRYAPDIPVHVSVQANITNYAAACEWARLGASRIVVSRELSLVEIARIRKELPPEVEIEAFVHGAMCLSYSGRCYLSSYLASRDANHGDCAQSCRWSYTLMEEKRPGEYMPVIEQEGGTYILNANDLCMMEHISKMTEAGISSLKIEGRAKTVFYVASVVRAYRSAIDAAALGQPFNSRWLDELEGVSHRKYSTGFYLGDGSDSQDSHTSAYMRQFEFVAVVLEHENGRLTVEQRNKFCAGEALEALTPGGQVFHLTATGLKNKKGAELEAAAHARMVVSMDCQQPLPVDTLLRRRLPGNPENFSAT